MDINVMADTTNKEDELRNNVVRIIATMPMVEGITATEEGWAKYGENEKEAIDRLMQLIKSRDQQIAFDEKYLLECFEAVARYAQDPTELGGMKPETALMNFKNIGIKSSQQIALEARKKHEGIGAYMAAASLLIDVGYLLSHRSSGELPEVTSEVIGDLYDNLKKIFDENKKYMKRRIPVIKAQKEEHEEDK